MVSPLGQAKKKKKALEATGSLSATFQQSRDTIRTMDSQDYLATNLQKGLRSEEKSESQINQKATVVNKKQSVKPQAKVVRDTWEVQVQIQCTPNPDIFLHISQVSLTTLA